MDHTLSDSRCLAALFGIIFFIGKADINPYAQIAASVSLCAVIVALLAMRLDAFDACLFAVPALGSLPFAILGVLPNAILSDIAVYDTQLTGRNHEVNTSACAIVGDASSLEWRFLEATAARPRAGHVLRCTYITSENGSVIGHHGVCLTDQFWKFSQ